MPTKSLGVFVAAVGCFASGWLFSVFFAKALGLAKEEGDSTAALEEELARVKESKETAENRVAELESENARFRKQRIEINSVRLLLAPVNKPVVFEPVPLAEIEGETGWIALEDFAKEFNQQLEVSPP